MQEQSSDRLRPSWMTEGRATQDAVAEMAEVQIMKDQSSASVFNSSRYSSTTIGDPVSFPAERIPQLDWGPSVFNSVSVFKHFISRKPHQAKQKSGTFINHPQWMCVGAYNRGGVMEFDATTTKILLAIISAFGTFAAVFLSTWQANRIRAELLEKFDSAVANEQKHSVTELVGFIHGLRMNLHCP